jgi:hypothetical protein
MNWRKMLLWGLPALFVILQLFRIEKTNPPVVASHDFRAVMQPPADVARILETSCYDCHSHETRYPWYSNVAPFSWMLANHVHEGREHLNFSTFGTLSQEDRAEFLHESAEEVEEGHMPIGGYVALHREAALSDEQRTRLVEWFERSNPGGSAAEEEVTDDRKHEAED